MVKSGTTVLDSPQVIIVLYCVSNNFCYKKIAVIGNKYYFFFSAKMSSSFLNGEYFSSVDLFFYILLLIT